MTALHRHDLDLANGRVRAAYSEHSNGRMVLGPSKSRAGVRAVNIPASIVPDVQGHLDKYAKPGPNALVFTGHDWRPGPCGLIAR